MMEDNSEESYTNERTDVSESAHSNAVNSVLNLAVLGVQLEMEALPAEPAALDHSGATEVSDWVHLPLPVQETGNVLISTEELPSSFEKASESAHLPIPVLEAGNVLESVDEPLSSSEKVIPDDYLPIPVSLPPTDECQLCGSKFLGNFCHYRLNFCTDCDRFQDSPYCESRNYKRSYWFPNYFLDQKLEESMHVLMELSFAHDL